MCGFAGFIDLSKSSSESELRQLAKKMNAVIDYRGPDSCGEWIDIEDGVALGHRRLSIIDLSADGSQPMVSPSGRYVIIYNGEIYNFEELRKDLPSGKYSFMGHSDTELILAYIEEYGLENALKDFVGMFAFALWDKREKQMSLGRDRMGIKPLYYSLDHSNLVFGSELKTLIASGKIKKQIDLEALREFFKKGYINAPNTIFQNVYKLPSGSILQYSLKNKSKAIKKYWDATHVIEHAINDPFRGDSFEALNKLQKIIDEAVACRMIADVPLGAFLSGGIDSSLVVSTMQKLSKNSVKSFSIGFEDSDFNEATHAKEVAEYLGTNHTELYVTDKQAREVIPALPSMWDEPFADPSQIPTYLVSKLTRNHVTVSLSGDGGDELFGGYDRYFIANSLWKNFQKINPGLRTISAQLLDKIPHGFINSSYKLLKPALAERFTFKDITSKIEKFSLLLQQNSEAGLYEQLNSHWTSPELVINNLEHLHPDNLKDTLEGMPGRNSIEKMMALDLITYLPNDILTKLDRASMANSLEARVPLLDHRVVEFAWKLPYKFKVHSGDSKWILKQLLYEYIPEKIVNRPKMGFGIPVSSWLRGDLKEWAKSLLSRDELAKHGLLNEKVVEQTLKKHLDDEVDCHYQLWNALMFQSWYNEWMDV